FVHYHVRVFSNNTSYLAKLILQRDHDMSHGGPQQVKERTRREYWITKLTRTAQRISNSCVFCIEQRTQNMQQKMANLDPVRTQITSIHTHSYRFGRPIPSG
ncbi:MAG: hypothetical protein GY696_38535, partial [Gammaproteobacteria bacterium]|nr:hypothetical protein [Gammaproteobacteria bacterium]